MKNILVPTDFSPYSSNAVKFAYLFAKKNGYKFSLLNIYNFSVYDPNMPPEILADVISQSATNAEEGLNFLITELEKKFPDFKNYLTNKITADGNTVYSIEKAAEEGKFDLIIMGTKGASGLEEVLIGSTAYSVLSKSTVPVLVIPEKSEYTGMNTVLYAVDLTCSELPAIETLQDILDIKNKDLTFLHLTQEFEDNMTFEEKKYLDEIKERMKDISFKFEFAKCENVAETIEDFVNKLKIDLIVVSKKKRDFFENLFHKSVSKKLACHTDVPLLALQK